MKQRTLLIFTLLFISMSMFSQNTRNAYEGEWKKVEEFTNQSLPQSTIKVLDNILQQAIKEKNTPQIVKAYVYLQDLNYQIDRNNDFDMIKEVETLLTNISVSEDKALLHSILADMYMSHYSQNRWQVNRRTNLANDVPADMKEWTANIYENKIYEHLQASVEDKDLLNNKATKTYDDIIELGKDSRIYQPTLYDFVMNRTIETAKSLRDIGNEEFDPKSTGASIDELVKPAKEYINLKINATKRYATLNYYQQYLADLQKRGLTSATILVELDKFRYLSGIANSFDNNKKLDALLTLEKIYAVDETTVEIIAAIVDQLQTTDYLIPVLGYEYSKRGIPQVEELKDSKLERYNWLKRGIAKYPNYQRIGILKNKLTQLESPILNIQGKTAFYPEDKVVVDIVHQNNQIVTAKDIVLQLYKVDGKKEIAIKSFPLHFDSKTSYESDSAKLDLEKLPLGKYFLKSNIQNNEYEVDRLSFSVSNMMSYARNSAKNEYEIYVVDRKNGKPVKGATVTIKEVKSNNKENKDKKTLAKLTTNDLGLVTYKDKKDKKDSYRYDIGEYTVSLGADEGLEVQQLYSGSYNHEKYTPNQEELNSNTTSLFADRSIYRPGQTIYYKAITTDKDSKVVANSKQVVKLYNPNGEVVVEKTLASNEFGSIAGEFILPQGGLVGQHWMTVNDNAHLYIRVEEYKRPTFEVKFDKIDKTFSFGDKITLKGNAKTFSGISLQNTDVQYRITRRPFSLWRWGASNESHYDNGTVKTKDDGTFEIEFTAEAGDGNNLFGRKMYTFDVTANVTDLNGETQSNNYTISVGEVSMMYNVEIPNQIEKLQDLAIKIAAVNLDGADIESSGTYVIYTLDKNDSIQSKVWDGAFKTGEQKELASKIKSLHSGKLRIELKGKDDNGKEVTSKKDFVLYSYNDKKPPYETNLWIAQKEPKFKGNAPAEIIYGTSNKDAYILYQIYNNSTIFERKFVKLSDENQNFKIPYQTAYGEEVYVSFTSVKDGELDTQNILLSKEEEKQDTSLKIKLDVFRDKLRPGQEETWTMSIRDSKDKLVSAEVLASMYDTSLDQIVPFAQWMLNRPYIHKDYMDQLDFNYFQNPYGMYSINLKHENVYADVAGFDFDRFKSNFNINAHYGNNLARQRNTVLRKSVSPAAVRSDAPDTGSIGYAPGILSEMVVVQESAKMDDLMVTTEDLAMGGATPVSTKQEPQIRRNFNETAFFFPQLRTNEQGETVVSFTVPESNTTWRFRALAHDKDSKVGELEKMVVTRKELMITPNMPRFVRHGDKTSISTKVSNLSENAVAGDVRIEFFNPMDDKTIDLGIKDAKQSFSLEKDASSAATWTFDVPSNIDMMGVRIVAESESFSDGEQHVLSVLPNRMLVTETMPVDVLDAGEQTYTLQKLANNKSNSLDNYKLSFEFASNPAWYAVQALPTMSNPTNENAINWFASYYVNTLGASLMKQYPKVATMIEAWKKQGGDKETLVSKLSKNEELKTILLEETPWVLDAKSETEQMERLSLLFDLNRTKNQTSDAIRKLEELQATNGGWTWYKGMYPNRSTTQYILYGFAKLQLVGMVEHPEEVKMMQMNALKFVDEKIVEDFVNLKKYDKNWKDIKSISTSQLEYLYMRAMYRDIPITQEAREAERFYTEVISQNWTKIGLYEKSLLAIVTKQLGEKELANKIVNSIKEHAVDKKEMGMYWPNNSNSVFLSQSAVSTHTFMMEAMQENGATTAEMDRMKRWLVKQKQTQIWESTHATIDAIGALLANGSDWLSSDAVATIKVGNETIKMDSKELGTGYVKTSWSKPEIDNSMAKVTINSTDSKPAYGSLYWQYYEDLDKITKQDGSLNVNKELYKEVTDKSGKSLAKITESNPLNVGDRVIVRLVVRTDRDLEFVQLKDMRASCFEPVNTTSGAAWQNGAPYYQATKDASTNFYFDVLPKGTYVFEYAVYANRTGEYANGITSIQCAYAPEFASHTAGIKVTVK